MSGADALRRKSKASTLVAAYLALLEEQECKCGYFESARCHQDRNDPAFHPIDVLVIDRRGHCVQCPPCLGAHDGHGHAHTRAA